MKHIPKGTKVRAVGFRGDAGRMCNVTEGVLYETLLDSFWMYGYLYTAVLNDINERIVCRLHRFEVIE